MAENVYAVVPNVDQRNRFVSIGQIDSATGVGAGSFLRMARFSLNVPDGKRLYLRRARWWCNVDLSPRVQSCEGFSWTGPQSTVSSNGDDIELDVIMSSVGRVKTCVSIQIFNPTAGSLLTSAGDSLFIELEVR